MAFPSNSGIDVLRGNVVVASGYQTIADKFLGLLGSTGDGQNRGNYLNVANFRSASAVSAIKIATGIAFNRSGASAAAVNATIRVHGLCYSTNTYLDTTISVYILNNGASPNTYTGLHYHNNGSQGISAVKLDETTGKMDLYIEFPAAITTVHYWTEVEINWSSQTNSTILDSANWAFSINPAVPGSPLGTATFNPSSAGLDSDLQAIAALGTTGIAVRTGTGTWTTRAITNANDGASTTTTTITNGDGVAGAPTIRVETHEATVKRAVFCASTANITTLAGLLTIDGQVLSTNDRVLVKDQTTTSANGIYVASSGAWVRASDFSAGSVIASNGAVVYVRFGTANAGKYYKMTSVSPVVGSDPVVFAETLTASGGTPAGASSQLQYNNGGVFGASANFDLDVAGIILKVGTPAAGTGRIVVKGAGTSSATYSWQGFNSTNTEVSRIDNQGYYGGNGLTLVGGFNQASHFTLNTLLQQDGTSMTNTTGDVRAYDMKIGFAPTSGTVPFAGIAITPTINQVGSTGITRGLWVAPTLTAAADWRSIDIANTTGKGIWQTGASVQSSFAGNVGFGGQTNPSYPVDAGGTSGIRVSIGTDAQRVAAQGVIRYSTTQAAFEGYTGAAWVSFGAGGGGTPGGSDGQIQYNNGGAFGGASQMYYDDVQNRFSLNTNNPAAPFQLNRDAGVTIGSVWNTQIAGYTPACLAGEGNGVSTIMGVVHANGGSAVSRPILSFACSRGTLNAPTTLANGDMIGSFGTAGYNGTGFQSGGLVDFYVDGTPASDNMPTRISFVTGGNFSTRLQRLVVFNNGRVNISNNSAGAGYTANAALHVRGAAASTNWAFQVDSTTLNSYLFAVREDGVVSLGSGSPSTSAILDMTSTAKGLGLPAMTGAQRAAIGTPKTGLVVFDTDANAPYFKASAQWVRIAGNTPTVTSITSSGTPTPNCDTTELYDITAQAVTGAFGAPTGTPQNGQRLAIRIKDNGTARTLSWNAIYRAVGVTLPLTTTANKTHYLGFQYNSNAVKWDFIASAKEV